MASPQFPDNCANLSSSPLHAHSSLSSIMQRNHVPQDEGFSEETRSQQSDDSMMYESSAPADDEETRVLQMTQFVLARPVAERKKVAEALIKSLPNSDKESLKQLIENLTHFDPVTYLPNEIFLSILSYLAPKDLLTCSTVSKIWRVLAQDEKIWRSCFVREGWLLDRAKMDAFEQMAGRRGLRVAQAMMHNPTFDLDRKSSRKRQRDEAFSEGEVPSGASSGLEATKADEDMDESDAYVRGISTGGNGERDDAHNAADEDSMSGIESNAATIAASSATRRISIASSISNNDTMSTISPPRSPVDFKPRPSIFQPNPQQPPKLSWPYLYKQRRRLEANWDLKRYKMFQLPQLEHPEDGHLECVYTIQHTPNHLVSGSRDRNIHIWDLRTYRCIRKLEGHTMSVLCLQFDERPEHDIIVSGGSDSAVIIWRFSTGKIIKDLRTAHTESVLNLRFDDRYIATCSKDKTIKIWSRQALERDSPLIPTHVLGQFMDQMHPIEPYTLLTTLVGHHAAVNAVMIKDNIIVSASGDRTIKSWDINSGTLKKSYVGHTKGIACVQFDGRRIVSGSSDNTVRIFDAEKQAEIACLSGHGNLVRTVQARFGDLDTITDAELEAEARAADEGFEKARMAGMQLASGSRRSARNAGSSRPEEMLSTGTTIPPGGGGSKWAKIVSGSYDETVIVWKKEADGKWGAKLRLNQNELLGNPPRRRHVAVVQGPPPNPAAAGTQQVQQQVQQQAQQLLAQAQASLGQANQLLAAHQQQQHTGNAQPANNQQAAPAPAPQVVATTTTATFHTNTTTQQTQTANANNTAQSQPQQTPAATAGPASAPVAVAAAAAGPANAAPNAAAQNHLQPQAHARDSNRVFKLQFDARRIICCSQNKTIVGWDFANGDKELERIGEWSLETA